MDVVDVEFVAFDMDRNEKWHTHDVIPVHVGHKYVEFFDSLLDRNRSCFAKSRTHVDKTLHLFVTDFST